MAGDDPIWLREVHLQGKGRLRHLPCVGKDDSVKLRGR